MTSISWFGRFLPRTKNCRLLENEPLQTMVGELALGGKKSRLAGQSLSAFSSSKTPHDVFEMW
jgi:hypothetical protein